MTGWPRGDGVMRRVLKGRVGPDGASRPAGAPFRCGGDWQATWYPQPPPCAAPATWTLRQPGESAAERGRGARHPHGAWQPLASTRRATACGAQTLPGWRLPPIRQLSVPWPGTAALSAGGEASTDLSAPVPGAGSSPGGRGQELALPAARPGLPWALPGQPPRPTGRPGWRAVAAAVPGRGSVPARQELSGLGRQPRSPRPARAP